jgi:hypothetical protein
MSPSPDAETVWLSGAILTPLNKLLPVLWLTALAGVVVWVFATTGRIAIAPDFRFLVALTLVATGVLLGWTVRLQRVGYRGRELIVSNYRRAAHIPFSEVEAVEPVWWYRGRMVRIRFRGQTPFGSTVYDLPKWGPIRCLYASPHEELRGIISNGGP